MPNDTPYEGDPRTPKEDLERHVSTIIWPLATNLDVMQALAAGVPVPRASLNQNTLRRLGEPLTGPDIQLTAENVEAFALRLLVTQNGDAAEIAHAGLVTQTIHEFAEVDEPSAEPILGDEGTTLLSMGGMLVLYGDGGAGKTTLELDLVMHLASGTAWQGIPVHGQPRILIVENEGPRGMFRKKTRAKLAAWNGRPVDERIHVLEDPWAVFSFADETYRDHLRHTILEHSIDIVAAGPVNRLGIHGGGTPEEVGAFILNIELIRQQLPRPLAVIFAHHENKAGDVSGAWEGVPDTLGHVQNQGNGHTRLHWQKCRWGPELHGKTWTLSWRDGETFELEEKEDLPDSHYEDAVLAYVIANPGCSANAIETNVEGSTANKRKARESLISQELVENRGSTGRYAFYATSPTSPTLAFGSDARIENNEARLPPNPVEPTSPSLASLRGGERQRGEVGATPENTGSDPDADIPF